MEVERLDYWMDRSNFHRDRSPTQILGWAKWIDRRITKFIPLEWSLLLKSITNTKISHFLQCLCPEEAELALCEIHEGMCENYFSARTLVRKTIGHGYYLPTMLENAKDLVTWCSMSLAFASFIHTTSTDQIPIIDLMPLAQWDIDLLASFLIAKTRQYQFLVVAVNNFTKQVKTKQLACVKAYNIERFVWKSIICRFRMQRIIIASNRPQFKYKSFKTFLEKWKENLKFASVTHHERNGQAKATKKSNFKCSEEKNQRQKWCMGCKNTPHPMAPQDHP